jgi:hypothetical protein
MLRRWSNAMVASGAALLVGGAAFACLKIATELKFGDLTSGNPTWHRPAATSLDLFILSFPAGSVFLGGLILLVAGGLARGRRSRAERR